MDSFCVGNKKHFCTYNFPDHTTCAIGFPNMFQSSSDLKSGNLHVFVVQIIGLEHIRQSTVLWALFLDSKDWIDAATRTGGEEVNERTMRILPKTIGRNPGYVVKIYSANGKSKTTFYAKAQSVSMDTVLIHQLLKNMQCGPDLFHIPLLETSEGFILGVITKKVKDWSMVSSLTRAEQLAFLDERDRLLSTSFLLNILIELGRFGNIPNNIENWGFVDCFDTSIPHPQMALIDFSRGNTAHRTFESEKRFRQKWEECLQCIIHNWPIPTRWDLDDTQAEIVGLYSALQEVKSVEAEAKQFPFLQSQETISALLQSACNDTAMWLHETVQRARALPTSAQSSHSTLLSPTPTGTGLNAWQHVPRPNTTGLHNQYAACVYNYELLVAEWNFSLLALWDWFPFRSKDTTSGSSSIAGNGDPTGYNALQDDTSIPVMIEQLLTDGLPVYNGAYDCIAKPPKTMYDWFIERKFKLRCMSMDVNVCKNDFGEATELHVQFSDQAPVGSVTDKSSVYEASAAGPVEGDLPTVNAVVSAGGKKRKSKNTGRKKRKRIRKQSVT